MFKDKFEDKNIGWQSALHIAEREILRSQNRLRSLRNSVRIIKRKIEHGEPWPGSAGTQSREHSATRN